MRPALTGATRVAGLIGAPDAVEASLSPRMHNAAFAEVALDWVYVGFPVAEGRAMEAIRGLGAAGVRGLNVTRPHKLAAAGAVDRLEGLAAAVGAVNTVEVRDGELVGHNTDGPGLLRFLAEEAAVPTRGLDVLLLGAGGAARAAVAALAAAGAASITVTARTPERAEALRALAGGCPFRAVGWDALPADAAAGAGLVLNASPVGERGEPPPVPVAHLAETALVVDLITHPRETRLVAEARRRGLAAHGGLGMLVHQAGLSFEIWTGLRAPLPAMREAAGGS